MKTTNLIEIAWLPVLDQAGQRAFITPAQVAEDGGLRYRTLASPRPDFDGALLQFLIGLLQTAFMPVDEAAWKHHWNTPPTPEELDQAFTAHANAFQLGGYGSRFMQDLSLQDGEAKPIATLLLDAPGGNTVRNNQDHFIKRDTVAGICPACAATALFCLQTNAPSGGQGHRVGLRGGGPLTTLLVPKEDEGWVPGLWHVLWLNVLPAEYFLPEEGQGGQAAIFPWLASTRTSEKNQKTTPQQAHPLQMFWGMPRRIRLDFENLAEGTCDLCGQASPALLTHYATRNFGVSYEGWIHVLSPHSRESAGKPYLPAHGQPGGIGFRYWAGLVVADMDNRGKGRIPAKVVGHAASKAFRRKIPADIQAFGYDMDNMKARAWVDSRMPFKMAVDETKQAEFEDRSRQFVQTANEAFLYLRGMVKGALYGEVIDKDGSHDFAFPPNTKIDTAFFDTLAGYFWRQGEPLFYRRLDELLQCLGDEAKQQQCAEAWLKNLDKLAHDLFDQAIGTVEEADHRLKAVVYARKKLGGMLRGDKLRGLAGLPVRTDKKATTTRKGGKRG